MPRPEGKWDDARVRKSRRTQTPILPGEIPESQRSVPPWESETPPPPPLSLPNDVEHVEEPVEHMDEEGGGGRRRGGGG